MSRTADPPPGPRRTPRRRDAAATRARLLAAAGEAFAADGYRGANLRRICASADANLGAVRYYFGGKLGLYREVLLDAYRDLLGAEPLPPLPRDDPERALRVWLGYFLRMIVIRRRAHPYLSRVLSKELAQPTEVLDEIVRLVIAPMRAGLARIVAQITGAGARSREVAEKTNLVIFLCIQFEMVLPVLERLRTPPPATPAGVGRLAERVHRFALAGLRA